MDAFSGSGSLERRERFCFLSFFQHLPHSCGKRGDKRQKELTCGDWGLGLARKARVGYGDGWRSDGGYSTGHSLGFFDSSAVLCHY